MSFEPAGRALALGEPNFSRLAASALQVSSLSLFDNLLQTFTFMLQWPMLFVKSRIVSSVSYLPHGSKLKASPFRAGGCLAVHAARGLESSPPPEHAPVHGEMLNLQVGAARS